MEVTAITGPRECQIVENPDPNIRDEFARVKITIALMCTEYKLVALRGPCKRCWGVCLAAKLLNTHPKTSKKDCQEGRKGDVFGYEAGRKAVLAMYASPMEGQPIEIEGFESQDDLVERYREEARSSA